MAEAKNIYVFTYKQLAEALVKNQGIHEGLWGVYVKFGISASNIGPTQEEILPAAIVPVLEIGIQKFEKQNNLTVDAAEVNPDK